MLAASTAALLFLGVLTAFAGVVINVACRLSEDAIAIAFGRRLAGVGRGVVVYALIAYAAASHNGAALVFALAAAVAVGSLITKATLT